MRKIRKWLLENCHDFQWQLYPALLPLWDKSKVLDVGLGIEDHYLIMGPLQFRWSAIAKGWKPNQKPYVMSKIEELVMNEAMQFTTTATTGLPATSLTRELMDEMIDKLLYMEKQPAGAVISYDIKKAMQAEYSFDISDQAFEGVRYHTHILMPPSAWFTFDHNWQVLQTSNITHTLAQRIANVMRPLTINNIGLDRRD